MSMDLNDAVVALSNTLWRVKDKFGVNSHKVHMLRMMVEWWDSGRPIKVTQVMDLYTDTSRAITHRMIRELVSSKLLKEQPSKDDKRVKFLVPGAKFDAYAKAIKE